MPRMVGAREPAIMLHVLLLPALSVWLETFELSERWTVPGALDTTVERSPTEIDILLQ